MYMVVQVDSTLEGDVGKKEQTLKIGFKKNFNIEYKS